jgi:uncharacterized membrane protein YfcA
MDLSTLDYLAAASAAVAAGAINAVAGGGTLVSFPTLVAIGVPAVAANVTNTVALLPGYLAGSWAQREDLRPQLRSARPLAIVAFAGGLAGSVLLVTIPASAFRVAVPYLILASCVLLLAQDWIRDRLRPAGATRTGRSEPGAGPSGGADPAEPRPVSPSTGTIYCSPLLLLTAFGAAVYGGFFGAGLGIMLLAVLGMFSAEPLSRVNALKQALSFVINLVAALFFVFSGEVRWELVPVMAAGSVLGGFLGGRLVRVIDVMMLRRVVVLTGTAVAIAFWTSSRG